MFKPKAAFSGISVDNLDQAKQFYTKTLGLELTSAEMGLQLKLPGGGQLFIYDKPGHEPATFTVLNFVVDDIEAAVDELASHGVKFERYENMPQDDKGITRGKQVKMGPDIAWFKDPAGNILAVLED